MTKHRRNERGFPSLADPKGVMEYPLPGVCIPSSGRGFSFSAVFRCPQDFTRDAGGGTGTMEGRCFAAEAKAKPGLLIVYHSAISWWPDTPPSGDRLGVLGTGELHSTPDALQKEIGLRYAGHFVIGRDLDVY